MTLVKALPVPMAVAAGVVVVAAEAIAVRTVAMAPASRASSPPLPWRMKPRPARSPPDRSTIPTRPQSLLSWKLLPRQSQKFPRVTAAHAATVVVAGIVAHAMEGATATVATVVATGGVIAVIVARAAPLPQPMPLPKLRFTAPKSLPTRLSSRSSYRASRSPNTALHPRPRLRRLLPHLLSQRLRSS